MYYKIYFRKVLGEITTSPFLLWVDALKVNCPRQSPSETNFLETAEVVAYTPNCREQSFIGKHLCFYLFLLLGIDDSSQKKQNLKFPA